MTTAIPESASASPSIGRVVLLFDSRDHRKRFRFVKAALQAAPNVHLSEFDIQELDAQTAHTKVTEAIEDCDGIIAVGSVRRQLPFIRQHTPSPVIVRIGGDPFPEAVDRTRTAIGSLNFIQACKCVASSTLFKRHLQSVDGVITPNTATNEALKASGIQTPMCAVPPIRPWLTNTDAPGKGEINSSDIVTVANLQFRRKFEGVKRLIPAFELVLQQRPQTTWTIVGGGAWFEELQRTIGRLQSASNITCVGHLEQPIITMKQARVFWYASSLDSYPLVLSEAAWAAIPVVVEQQPWAETIIEHEATGYLIPESDASARAKHTIHLLTCNNLHAAVGFAGRQAVALRECPEAAGAAMMGFVNTLLAHGER